MDVISLGAAGVKNAVAGMGTALTEGQAREISRLTDTVFVCYDGDGAGRKASVKNTDILAKFVQNVKVVSLPDGKDPDETVRSEGYDGFMKYVDCALPLMEYKLKLCADANDLNTVNGRAKYVSQALAVLKDVENVAEREVYLGVVSELSGVGVQTLSQQVGAPVLRKSEPRKENAEEKEGKIMRASRICRQLRADGGKMRGFEQNKERMALLRYSPQAHRLGEGATRGKSRRQQDVRRDGIRRQGDTKRARRQYEVFGRKPRKRLLQRLPYDACKREPCASSCRAEGKIQRFVGRGADRATVEEIARLQKIMKSKAIEDKL